MSAQFILPVYKISIQNYILSQLKPGIMPLLTEVLTHNMNEQRQINVFAWPKKSSAMISLLAPFSYIEIF